MYPMSQGEYLRKHGIQFKTDKDEGYYFYNGHGYLQVFLTGTDNDPKEWWSNFTAIPKNYRNSVAHKGFLESASDLATSFLDNFDSLDYIERADFFGFSRGGGQIPYFASILGIKNSRVFTWGSPVQTYTYKEEDFFPQFNYIFSRDPINKTMEIVKGSKRIGETTVIEEKWWMKIFMPSLMLHAKGYKYV